MIRLDGITVRNRRSGNTLLKDITLSIEPGERIALLGPSGAGKSTLARVIAGALSPTLKIDSGRLEWIASVSDSLLGQVDARRYAVMIPQLGSGCLPSFMRVGQLARDVAMYALHEEPRNARDATTQRFSDLGLPQHAAKMFPHEMSGGMAGRAVLAIALAALPRLLILDEPTAGLDAETRNRAADIIEIALNHARTGMLLITHDVWLAKRLCKRWLLLQDGELIADAQMSGDVAVTGITQLDILTASLQQCPLPPTNSSCSSDVLLSATSVSVRYPSVSLSQPPALKDVSFRLRRGESLGVIGPSGAGKSTIARLICGLIIPTSGTIERDAILIPRPGNAAVQMVVQDPIGALNPSRPVLRWLERLAGRNSRKPILELADALGLRPDHLNRLPSELSGGECQRTALLGCLAVKPRILVLDEATSMLDEVTKWDILARLRRIAVERELTMLVIAHDLSVITYMCHSVIVLSQGMIVEGAPINHFLRHPASEAGANILRNSPWIL